MVEQAGWYRKAERFRSQVSGIESVLVEDGLALLFSQASKLGEVSNPVVVTVNESGFEREKSLKDVIDRYAYDLGVVYSPNVDPNRHGFSDHEAVTVNWTSFSHPDDHARLSNSIRITRQKPNFGGGYPIIDIKTEKRMVRRLVGKGSADLAAGDVGKELESRSNTEILLIANKLVEKYISELSKRTTAAQTG